MLRAVRRLLPFVPLALCLASPGCTSRDDLLKAKFEREAGEKPEEKDLPPPVPPDPVREELRPVLAKIYSNERLPDVLDEDVAVLDQKYPYELTPGVLSTIKIQKGLSKADKAKAIIIATAEADSWAFRKNARRNYADLIHKIKYGYGEDQKQLILRQYAHLRLLSFFNGKDADATIGELSGDVRGVVEELRKQYIKDKDKIWEDWMGVKMYARRVVAGDEPFKSVLRQIKKDLGHKEVPPRTWADSLGPEFKAWGEKIEKNEDLFIILTNLRELRERVEFTGDTHGLWLMEGSPDIPEKAKKLKPDKDTGFAVLREDLGGGYNELTFIFSKKLSGSSLKRAFLQSLIYRQLLADFQMLATAGGDFAKKGPDGSIDRESSIVPDKYDPLYAQCGSKAAVDTLINSYKSKYPLVADLKASQSDGEKILKIAHECIIEGARGDIKIPDKEDEFDYEGPAPGSRLALFQMLARFEHIDVNMKGMADEAPKTEEDKAIEDAEARLKALSNKK